MTSRLAMGRTPLPHPLPASRGEGDGSIPSPAMRERAGERAVLCSRSLRSPAPGAAHSAKAPGAAANPIAPVVLPKTNAEAQAAFDEGVRLMKMGKKHYKEARKPLHARHRAGRPPVRGVARSRRHRDRARQLRQGGRRLRARPQHPAGRAQDAARLRREPAPRPPPEEGGVGLCEVAELGPERLRDALALRPGAARGRARSTSRWSRPGCFWEPPVRTFPHRNCL